MALKSVFNALKREGYVVKPLDMYLLSLNGEDNDRAIDVNAPSQIGKCLRQRYYARTGAKANSNAVDPRTRRIFDNGTKTHERLQEYLKDEGMLILDEVPVYDEEYNIQGHTDGLINLPANGEIGILEIKSINSNGFSQLKDAKAEHKKQGLIYAYCVEKRRKEIQQRYASYEKLLADKANLWEEYSALYTHLKGGSKYTREEKVNFQCMLHFKMDCILYGVSRPVTKVVFLYENKDNQELKEFCVTTMSEASQEILGEVLDSCTFVNDAVRKKTLPPRISANRSSMDCRFCPYSLECFN